MSTIPFPRLTFDLDAYLSTQQKTVLKQVYGDQYAVRIEAKYRAILENQYKSDEYIDLKNPIWSRIVAALKPRLNLFDPLEEQIKLPSKGNVLCSEFVAKSLLQGFKTLEAEIERDCKRNGITLTKSLTPPVNKWLRMSTVYPSTLAKLKKTKYFNQEKPPQIICDLFQVKEKAWLA